MDLCWNFLVYILGLFIVVINCQVGRFPVKDRKRGALIGKLKTLDHDVSGTLWAVDEDTLYLENFHYDGTGPDAFFWMGSSDSQPSPRGFIVPQPSDTSPKKDMIIPYANNENLILHLPAGKKIVDLRWFSVWCRRFTVDFGNVLIPGNLDPPRKRVLPEFMRLSHGVRSGNVTILDAKTFYIPNLHYDGVGPDAFFWVGKGNQPGLNGQKVPNEMGSFEVLRSYEGEDIEIQLPGELTVYDINYLSIWSARHRHNFGHVVIPPAQELWVPPALGQTRIKPNTFSHTEFNNCLQVNEKLQVEWQAGQNEVQIKLTAEIREDQYIAFGISADPNKAQMVSSDIVVAFYDRTDGTYHAVDYMMTSKSQCDGSFGVCPDERLGGFNDASVIRGERLNGVTSIIYSRPYNSSDPQDIPIRKDNRKVAVVAAIGSLNDKKEANFHQEFYTKETMQINFNSIGENSCTSSSLGPRKGSTTEYKPWQTSIIRDVYNFSAVIGPTGGKRGYDAIIGSSSSWGITWWINGKLIPEIYVERGQTYYFTVEGGNDLNNPAQHHPFYITDDPSGGYHQKSLQEQDKERIYAGVKYSKLGTKSATAEGRLCQWRHMGKDSWKTSDTFAEYKNTLHKVCNPGQPGQLVWTVMEDTPDLLYYQCYTHRYLGWKIHVNDPGFNLPQSAAPLSSSSSWLLLVLFLLVTSIGFR